MSRLSMQVFLLFTVLFSFLAFAQAVPAPNPDASFWAQVLGYVQQFGGLAWMAKVAGLCLLIVAAIKTSFVQPLWAKLPPLVQTLIAPLIALIGGIMSLGSGLTFAAAVAYIGSGAGAVIMHELLDGVKSIPGIGTIYVTMIGIIESILFKPAQP